MAIPVSTYRLQLTTEFGFSEAAGQAPYLASLGVTHAYLSPILQAVPGSAHGYDVTDHSQISADLGGEAGFREMAARFAGHGIGIVLDIVPNHMAIGVPETLNRQLWEVLRDGPRSRYAHWFDIDWAAGGGKMLLPILGSPLEECESQLSVRPNGGPDGAPVLSYFDHLFPLRPGSAGLPLPDLLDAQHYRLAWWREGSAELNWRRFFDVTSLIGIRVEDADVFAATHEVVLGLVNEGLIDGLRVDHPDGLADPRGYLRRLAEATCGRWTVAEKILEADERLPCDWPCAGTTGYDALRVVDGLFVDPAGGEALTREYARYAGRSPGDFAEVAVTAKREVASVVLAAEAGRLARLLVAARPATDPDAARTAITEVLAAFGVYRAYVHPGAPPSAEAERQVRDAVVAAKKRLSGPLRELADAVGDLALGEARGTGEHREFTVRFGQTTGPVLAKGVEDTAAYRWPRLLGRNEVGGDPDRFAVSPAEFHEFAAHLASEWPASMTTLSTHDTKRQEDVRARLAVLSEMPSAWGQQVAAWQRRAVDVIPEAEGLDPEITYMMWQTLVGAWPLPADRLETYLTKAMREAKIRTSWLSVDEGYEGIVQRVGRLALNDDVLREGIASFVASIGGDALANSLGAKLTQLTMPGVPDVYQGCELSALSLVDPDNRRPVDFGRRGELLSRLEDGDGGMASLDAAKLLITFRALRLRQDHPEWFLDGSHEPLSAHGPAEEHAVAFVRGGHAVTVATRLPRGLRERGGWGDTTLELPSSPGKWRDVLTGQEPVVGKSVIHVKLADLLRQLPVALLTAE